MTVPAMTVPAMIVPAVSREPTTFRKCYCTCEGHRVIYIIQN